MAQEFKAELGSRKRKSNAHDRQRKDHTRGGPNAIRIFINNGEHVLGHRVGMVRVVIEYTENVERMFNELLRFMELYFWLDPRRLMLLLQVIHSDAEKESVDKAHRLGQGGSIGSGHGIPNEEAEYRSAVPGCPTKCTGPDDQDF